MCKETYSNGYPALFSTPPYNFFYVEVMLWRSDYNFRKLNTPLLYCIVFVWSVLWILLVIERFTYGRLVWNNMYLWLVAIPWIWMLLLAGMAIANLSNINTSLGRVFRMGAKESLIIFSDAIECALYIHSASTGTELIHGKGLNHYASGHIDPRLNSENVWQSGLMLVLTALHVGGASFCAQSNGRNRSVYNMYESNLWILPMYSKCTLVGNYSHLLSTLLFGGLMFSYMTVAFVLLKTALHTIFEYRVKLVFVEQAVVGGLIVTCMALSLLFATSNGLALLESVEAVMSGLATPYVCLLELVALLYVYRGHDFISDMNVATEENLCSTRINTQWHIIPFIALIVIILKMIVLNHNELPERYMYIALTPLAAIVLSVPLRACHNAYVFLHSTMRRRNN
ncbi:unnamed protein product [Parnassius mnemosyne]|uniref:Uncharacterized protein n=1 Tax=Parnassius mnemosyne TaxID=213953 RepID=A0AAV1LY14_9NEOP